MRRTALLASTAQKVLTGTYGISGYGGHTHDLAFAEPAHDWSVHRGIRLWWDGRDNARKIDFELKDGGADDEASEPWAASFTDDFSGWKQIDLPFTAFTFRTDCQPVCGIVTFPAGTASGTSRVVRVECGPTLNQSGGWTITWQGSSGDITPGTTILEAMWRDPTAPTCSEDASAPLTGHDVGVVVVGDTSCDPRFPYGRGPTTLTEVPEGGRRWDHRGGGEALRRRRPSAADRPVRCGGGEAERGVPRGLSRRTARGGMPCGRRSRWESSHRDRRLWPPHQVAS